MLSSSAVIAIGGVSPGTLSKISFSILRETPLLIIGATEATRAYFAQFLDVGISGPGSEKRVIEFADDAEMVPAFLMGL